MKNFALIAATTVFLAATPVAFAQTATGSGEPVPPREQTMDPTITSPAAPMTGEQNEQMDQTNSVPLRTETAPPATGSAQPEYGTDASNPAVTAPPPGKEPTGNSQGNSSGTY